MSRARNIKPGFFKNENLADCDPLARILFAGLWCMADRSGRLEDRPRKIKAECLPYDDCDADALLRQLQTHGFIVRYGEETKYIQVLAFAKHQNPHVREPASSIPAPCEHSARTVQSTEVHGTGPADSSFLIPDSPINNAPPTAVAPATQPDPIFGTGLDFLTRKGVPTKAARSFLGLLRKEVRDDLTVSELLTEAERMDASDPVAWLRAAAKSRRGSRAPPSRGPTSKAGQAIALLEGMKRGQRRPDSDADAALVVLGDGGTAGR